MALLTSVFVFFFWIDVTSLDDAICPTLYDNRYNITWPSTSDYTISDPPCVDQTRRFVIRRCNKGHWDSDPECYYVQTKNLPQCPEGFIESEELDICYQVSEEKTPFPPKCPYQEVLPFNYYKSAIKNIDNVWMPVKRESWDYMRWTEASSLYKTKFTDDYLVTPGFQTVMNLCLVYNFSHSTAFADNCSSQHHSLCVYKKFSQLSNRFCGSEKVCYQSDFSTKSKCFCLGNDQDFRNTAEFLQPFQNNICMELANETCAIGLEKNENGNYVWTNSKKELNYTFWSTDAIFDDSHRFGACKPQGWVLTQKPVSCFWYEKTVEMPEPELILLYDNTSLILNITNPQSLHWFDSNSPVYCFTNADRDLLYRYSNLTMKFSDNNSIVYEFRPLNYGPGHYWCESFKAVDLATPLRSNTVFLRQAEKFKSEFVMMLMFYYSGGNNDLNDFVYNVLTNEIFVNELNSSFVFRSMNISYFGTNLVLVNVHFTSQVMLDTFETAKQFIYQTIIDKVYDDVLSGDFCFEYKSKKLTWPRTLIDNTAVSKELCFKADNTRFTKSCQGNFIDGGQWFQMQIEENCEIPEYSNATDELLAVTHFSQLSSLILNKFSYLYAIDFYVIYEFLKGFEATSFTLCNDACHWSVTLDYLQRVNRSVLEESQEKYNAIFHILHQTNRLLNNLNSTNISDCHQDPCGENNFHLMVASLRELSGIYVPYKKTQLAPVLEKNATTEYMRALGQDAAVWLSEQFLEGVNEEIKLIFTVFFENSFFLDVSSTVVLGPVFGLVFPNFNETFRGPIQMLQKIKNATAADCAVWNWIESKWEKVGNAVKTDQFLYCEFWQLGYFAVAYSNDSYTDSNVTECLTKILESNKTTAELINNLHEVSKRHDEFVPVDIALIGEILKKVNEDKEIDLRILAEIVSNLHEIKKEILFHSQQQNKATDTVLYYIDRIIENQDYKKSVEIVTDNFMIYIYNLKASNFSGVALIDPANLSHTQILEGDLEADDVANDDNITCAILLNKHLKNQFKEDTKVIVTVYLNDAFFNQKNPQPKYVSSIFGIILPEIQHFEGPVSILHKVDPENYQEQCSFWQFDQTLSGFWSKDVDPVTYASSIIRCSFWHTTHFALVLVDQEKVSHDPVLDWITNVIWSLSLLGLFFIILTAVLFKKWRENSGNQILLSFTFANILETVMFFVSSYFYHKSNDQVVFCTIIGAVLHYLVISQFCWMLVIGCLQYQRFVDVLGKQPTRIVLKSSLCGWGLPLFPVIGVLGLQNHNYLEQTFGLCYPTGLGLYLGVWIPILIITTINLVLYAAIIYNVIFKKTKCLNSGFKDKMLECRIAFLLFFMLGLTWIFGFLYEISSEKFFEYVFTITATSQGFVLFLFFIVFNISTRQMYLRAFKRHCYKYH